MRAEKVPWIKLNKSRNAVTAGVIPADASRVAVRVIRTDEELMIARSVCRFLGPGAVNKED
jgi:acetate kinase